jgi:hypothetical protein
LIARNEEKWKEVINHCKGSAVAIHPSLSNDFIICKIPK